MPELRTPTPRQLAAAATSLEAWLERLNDKHEAHLAAAYVAVRTRTMSLLERLRVERGRLVSTQANFRQAQAVHERLGAVTTRTLDRWTEQRLAADLGRVTARSARFLTTITGAAQAFTPLDLTWVEQLRSLNLAEFAPLGTAAVDQVARVMYEHLMGGARFRALERAVTNVLTGVRTMPGRPLVAVARRMAFDTTRHFMNQVTLYKAGQIGLTSFVYYGDVIRDSRPFCAAHAGELMTEARVAALDKQTWRGKSGPFRSHRGGYRCRHSFLPVQPEWVPEGGEQIQNYFSDN